MNVSRWIPEGASKAVSKDGFCVVYYGKTESGRLWAMGFHGKASKPDFYNSFKTEEQRARICSQYFANWADAQARKEKRKAEKKAFKHSLVVGSILKTSWGYDQTNIEYFEVTKLIGEKMVEVREIAQEKESTGFMSGDCVPVPGKYIGQPLRKRVLEGNRVDIHGGYGYADLETPVEVAGVKVYKAGHWTAYA